MKVISFLTPPLVWTTRQQQQRQRTMMMTLPRGDSVQRYTFGEVPTTLDVNDKIPRTLSFESPELISPEVLDAATALFFGIVLYLGPDVWLAALGLESGVRPGRSTELALGEVFKAEAFVTDAREGYAAEPPISVRLVTAGVYMVFGVAMTKVLTLAFDDLGFVFALACCGVIAGAVFEVGRPTTPTRSEAQAMLRLKLAFKDFASSRLRRTGSPQDTVHKTEIVSAFRRASPRYRSSDASGVSDIAIENIARRWLLKNPIPGNLITPAGFYKGLLLNPEPDVF